MKIKKNRFVSSFLSCVMIFSLCTPAFASEESPQLDKTAIYSQLEKQGALDMYDIHEAIYTATTPSIIPFGSDDEYTNVYAPDGGTLEYNSKKGDKPMSVGNTYLDFDDSYYYILGKQEVGVEFVLEQIIGRIPFVGTITSAVSTAKVLVDSNASVSIKNAGGYAMISVTDSVAGVSTVVRGWSNYPYIYLYDIHATNINVTLSPKNNPFNH